MTIRRLENTILQKGSVAASGFFDEVDVVSPVGLFDPELLVFVAEVGLGEGEVLLDHISMIKQPGGVGKRGLMHQK